MSEIINESSKVAPVALPNDEPFLAYDNGYAFNQIIEEEPKDIEIGFGQPLLKKFKSSEPNAEPIESTNIFGR